MSTRRTRVFRIRREPCPNHGVECRNSTYTVGRSFFMCGSDFERITGFKFRGFRTFRLVQVRRKR